MELNVSLKVHESLATGGCICHRKHGIFIMFLCHQMIDYFCRLNAECGFPAPRKLKPEAQEALMAHLYTQCMTQVEKQKEKRELEYVWH